MVKVPPWWRHRTSDDRRKWWWWPFSRTPPQVLLPIVTAFDHPPAGDRHARLPREAAAGSGGARRLAAACAGRALLPGPHPPRLTLAPRRRRAARARARAAGSAGCRRAARGLHGATPAEAGARPPARPNLFRPTDSCARVVGLPDPCARRPAPSLTTLRSRSIRWQARIAARTHELKGRARVALARARKAEFLACHGDEPRWFDHAEIARLNVCRRPGGAGSRPAAQPRSFESNLEASRVVCCSPSAAHARVWCHAAGHRPTAPPTTSSNSQTAFRPASSATTAASRTALSSSRISARRATAPPPPPPPTRRPPPHTPRARATTV